MIEDFGTPDAYAELRQELRTAIEQRDRLRERVASLGSSRTEARLVALTIILVVAMVSGVTLGLVWHSQQKNAEVVKACVSSGQAWVENLKGDYECVGKVQK